ncbi:MAG TPA: cytochrome c oxidase subunit 3 [Candidatus Methylomirabilis sp.]|nr:cytochrome c oxidase subunit 3 [Candidatus Methylomirabilis sp.]
MPGTRLVEDIELIIDDIGGGGGNPPPPGGDDDDGRGGRRGPHQPSSRRYATAIMLGIVSIVMFFMGMVAAYIFLRATNPRWVTLRLPGIVWFNTAVLLTSSAAIELARKKLALGDVLRFQRMWFGATCLGVLFLLGQLFAWRELVVAGFYVATNQASSFFYIFTALHGLHLLGGICALLYVCFRKFELARVSRTIAAEVASYYWHFMDALWIFLLALLYLGR